MVSPDSYRVTRALISVSDKTGIVDFARALHERGIELISTGGTYRIIKNADIPVRSVAELTGFPEMMDGRVKTLNPRIHGGLLALLDNETHRSQMAEQGIESIDLLVGNLYPFEQTLARVDADHSTIVENIDIGGPAMLRAAAKNYRWTAALVNPQRYAEVLDALDTRDGAIPTELRLELAQEAFAHTAHYDALIAGYLGRKCSKPRHEQNSVTIGARRSQALRYGENPHQEAALFGSFQDIFSQMHGKDLSYNNIVDIDAASKLILEFDDPTVTIIKHTNPCGVASASSLEQAYRLAFESDSKSPFGGIIAFNRVLDIDAARAVDEIFTEVLIAPSFSPEALELLRKKKNRRLVACDYDALRASLGVEFRSVAGGFLLQSSDVELLDESALRVVTKRQPGDEERAAMLYAWKVAKHVKSNAIVYASANRLLAVGAGQMSRVDSAAIAARKAADAGLSLQGSAVASDAFFPFADGLLEAVAAGASAVIQPGGSIRDADVIAAADEHNIAMMVTGRRHFRH